MASETKSTKTNTTDPSEVSRPTPPSPRARVRYSGRGAYDAETVHRILDEIPIGTVAVADEQGPIALPVVIARVGDELVTHASPASRLSRALKAGAPACVTVWALDGIVAARSWFHHSINYRGVVIQAMPRWVDDPVEKREMLRTLTDHVLPGRTAETRPPTDKEIAATAVFAFSLAEASAKVRTGPPIDDEADLAEWPVWAGTIPLRMLAGTPLPDAVTHANDTAHSSSVAAFVANHSD